MRVLVTGATGFIGRQLVKHLLAAEAEVYGLALQDDIANFEELDARQDALTLLPVDLRDTGATADALTRIQPDSIVHLAAAGVADPAIETRLAIQHNVNGTLNLIHSAFQNRELADAPGQLIVIRTPSEAHPANAYTASKAAAWSFCQMYARRKEWPIVGAMIFQAYGPGQAPHTFVQAALRAALAGENFAMTSGDQARDWIYLDDVVDGLVSALSAELSPGTSFDLGTGRRTGLTEVAKLAFQLVGRGGEPIPGALPDRSGESIAVAADIERTVELLDWRPQCDLTDGLSRVIASLDQ